MNKLNERIEYLESLGFTGVVSIDVFGYDTEYQFNDDGTNCSIYDGQFEIGDTIGDVLREATFYSCCGDPLDRDSMICPTCKEHC